MSVFVALAPAAVCEAQNMANKDAAGGNKGAGGSLQPLGTSAAPAPPPGDEISPFADDGSDDPLGGQSTLPEESLSSGPEEDYFEFIGWVEGAGAALSLAPQGGDQAPSPPQRMAVDEVRALNGARLTAYYRTHNPGKINAVDQILEIFEGRTEALNEKLTIKVRDRLPRETDKRNLREPAGHGNFTWRAE